MLYAEERTNYPLLLSVDDLGEGFRLVVQASLPIDPQRICELMCQAITGLVEALVEALRGYLESPIRGLEIVLPGC